jgi:hypothetical protein
MPWPRWWLTRASSSSRYRALFSMRFPPYRRSTMRGTHLGGFQAAGAAGVGHVTVVSLPRPLASCTMSSNSWPAMRLGKAEAA